MDYDLVQDYDLENIKQKEFGLIDNSTDIKYRYTSELFASFITGETYDQHGVIKLLKTDKTKLGRLFNHGIIPDYLIENYRGFYRLNSLTRKFLQFIRNPDKMKYTKEDLEEETLFEEVDVSKPLYVPSYNPDARWQLALPHKVADFSEVEKVRKYSELMTDSRLNEFYELSFDFWDLIMLHLHDPDPMQDLELGNYQRDYKRLDRKAQEIKRRIPEDWTVIFMSDHGRMEGEEHNKNAFYSCNRELFGSKKPHITDFYDKIIGFTKDNY